MVFWTLGYHWAQTSSPLKFMKSIFPFYTHRFRLIFMVLAQLKWYLMALLRRWHFSNFFPGNEQFDQRNHHYRRENHDSSNRRLFKRPPGHIYISYWQHCLNTAKCAGGLQCWTWLYLQSVLVLPVHRLWLIFSSWVFHGPVDCDPWSMITAYPGNCQPKEATGSHGDNSKQPSTGSSLTLNQGSILNFPYNVKQPAWPAISLHDQCFVYIYIYIYTHTHTQCTVYYY